MLPVPSSDEPSDADLLRRYVAGDAQEAFTAIVHRRVDLVYSVALRQCGGDQHLAEDVTQKVFADLARKATQLIDRPVLSGWLYRSAQFAASDVVRSERRRRSREQESQAMHEISKPADNPAHWERLRPLLDEALGELSEADRDAVALRFFEGRAFAEIGRALRLTEESARKRVDRAVDKLAGVLSQRGVTSTAAALGVALGNQALVAAPAGLAATVSGAALSAGTTAAVAAAASGVGASAGWIVFMSSTKATVGAGIAAVLAIGAAVYRNTEANRAEAELATLTQEHAAVRAKTGEFERRWQAAEIRATRAETQNEKLQAANEAARRLAQTAATTTTAGPAAPPITHDVVEARYRRAQELARNGDNAAALAEFLWCFDEGMPRVSSYVGVRTSFLLGSIEKTGPAGIAALRERRDAAQKRVLAGERDFSATQDFAALNRTLKEDDLTIAIYDALPPGDARRRTLASTAYDQLVHEQRYADAVVGRNYAQFASLFEDIIEEQPLPANTREPERIRQMRRESAVKSAAKNVEALAGAGELANARKLAERVLAYDGSDATRAVLREHLQRAGHPDLLAAAKP